MEDKYILNIGAGEWQLPIIKACNKLRYKLISVDINPNAKGLEYSNIKLNMSAYDSRPIFDWLNSKKKIRENIEAIITMGSRSCITTASELSYKLNCKTNCLSPNKAETIVNRKLFREFLKNNGFNYPKYQILNESDLEIDYPFVVKVTKDTSGSEGITLVRSENEFKSAIIRANKYVRESEIIVEEYIEGQDYGLFGLLNDKKLNLFQIITRSTSNYPYFLPKKYTTEKVDSKLELRLKDFYIKIIEQLNFESGPFYIEIKYSKTDNKIYPIECEPTIPAHIDYLISKSHKIDTSLQALNCVLKIENNQKFKKKYYSACEFVYSPKKGILKDISFVEPIFNGGSLLKKYRICQNIKNESAADILAIVYAYSNSIKVFENITTYADKIKIEIC
ncbi:MAG: acetyl-CoA carboxylase biotin carboxylase subunit family protein [Rhodothermaceae bacterium]